MLLLDTKHFKLYEDLIKQLKQQRMPCQVGSFALIHSLINFLSFFLFFIKYSQLSPDTLLHWILEPGRYTTGSQSSHLAPK